MDGWIDGVWYCVVDWGDWVREREKGADNAPISSIVAPNEIERLIALHSM